MTYSAQQRTKEVGIRKVLGASAQSVSAHISKDFLKLVMGSFVLAWPISYSLSATWLEEFAYRTTVGVGVFLLSGIVTLAVVAGVVAAQAWRAATADPVESLRTE